MSDCELTNTLVVLHLVSGRTDAAEGSVQILAGSRLAGARQRHTLVDIWPVTNTHFTRCTPDYTHIHVEEAALKITTNKTRCHLIQLQNNNFKQKKIYEQLYFTVNVNISFASSSCVGTSTETLILSHYSSTC